MKAELFVPLLSTTIPVAAAVIIQTIVLLIRASRLEQYARDHIDHLNKAIVKMDARLSEHEQRPQHGPTPYVSQPVCEQLHKNTEDRIAALREQMLHALAEIKRHCPGIKA